MVRLCQEWLLGLQVRYELMMFYNVTGHIAYLLGKREWNDLLMDLCHFEIMIH
jgi:hypothetical protein